MTETNPSDPLDGLEPQALADLLSPAPTGISPEKLPTSLGERYEVRGLLGQGGQGVVLAVRDHRLERDLAAKLPRQGVHGAGTLLEREAKLAASLEHPNILPTYDLAEGPGGEPLLLMRRAPGRSMEEALRACEKPSGVASGALSGLAGRAARLRVFLQLAEAIRYAHSRGVLHLDLKPANVRLGEYGEVFVMDWGLARRVTDEAAPVGGTPPYMAPELLEGLVPDERADVYSLGVTLYRMLSGGALPLGERLSTTADYRQALATRRPVPLAERAANLDADLAAVVDKACRLRRSERYRKVGEMVTDLEAALDGRPVSARRAGSLELVFKWVRRRSRLLGSVAVAALLVAVSGTFFLTEKLRRDRARLRAKARVVFDKGSELTFRVPPDFAGAERLFSRALEVDPRFADAWYARGRSRQTQGKFEAALTDLLQAADLDPSLIMARFHAGRIYMEQLGLPADAREQFAAMREVDAQNEYSLLGEGWLATLAGKWREAEALADRAEKVNPDLDEVHNLRGYVYSNSRSTLRDPERAVAEYDQYLAVVPNNVTALNNRALVLLQLRRNVEAGRDLDRALRLDPDYVYALTNRAVLRIRTDDFSGALADLNRAQRLRSNYIWIYLDRGTAYEHLGDPDKAREDYVTATGLEPENPNAYRRRAYLELGVGDFPLALDLYDRALELAGNESLPSLRRLRGLAAYYAGHFEKAEKTWKRNLKERPPGRRLYTGLLLWRLLVEDGREAEARDLLSALIGDEREKPHLRAAAAFCLGEITADAVLEAAPDLPAACEVFYYMGAARLARGRLAEAAQLLAACRATGYRSYTEHLLAGLELEFLEPKAPPRDDKVILLTGFEPFGGDDVNASWEAVKSFDGQVIDGWRIVVRRRIRAGKAPLQQREIHEIHRAVAIEIAGPTRRARIGMAARPIARVDAAAKLCALALGELPANAVRCAAGPAEVNLDRANLAVCQVSAVELRLRAEPHGTAAERCPGNNQSV